MASIYLAGPLFTSAERRWNDQVANALSDRGHDPWLPQREVGPYKAAPPIASDCLRGVDSCRCLVACYDGTDVDSGTAFEYGYAIARGKWCAWYRTDWRRGGEGALEGKVANYNVNIMLGSWGWRLELDGYNPSPDDVADAIDEWVRTKVERTASS